ncbi:MAG: PAS domain S-box protein [Chlamydiota bacterium]
MFGQQRRRESQLRKKEKMLAEKALRVSEERYRSVVTAMAEGVVVQNAGGVIVTCNPRAEQILGLTAAQMQGRTSLDPHWRTIHEDGSPFPGTEHPAMVTLHTGQPQHDVCMGVQKADGSVSWILVNSQPIFNGSGVTVDSVVTTFTDITEKRRTEEAVRASEERFRVALQNSPIVVFNQDRDLRYTWINSPVASWRERGWLWKTDAEILENAEDAARLAAVKRRILETGQGVREEIPIHFQGRTIYYDFAGEPLRDRAGNVAGITCAVTDITERKQAEEEVRQSKARLQLQIDRMPIGCIVWSREFRVMSWNPAAEQIFGFSAEEAMGQHPYDLIVPADNKGRVDAIFSRLLQGDATAHSTNENLTKDGRVITCHWTNTPLKESDGTVMGVLSMIQDITERKEAEEQLRRASLYARSLIEASLDPLVTINREGKITDVNRATELVTGVPRGRLIGSDFCEYFTEPDKAREGYQKVFEKESVHDYPLAIRHPSGQVTHVLYNASVFRNEVGEVEGVFAAARDISERKILEEQLLQAQKLEAIGRLAGGVAHDFNNIIGIILGYSALIQGKLKADDPSVKHLDSILKAAERAAALTRQLLAFSRKQVMDVRLLDLNERITELSKMLPRLIGENIEVVLHLAPDLGRVKADPVQFEQVLINLAVNARDAMPGGGRLRIASANVDLDSNYQRLHPEVLPGPYVMISVSDTGVGMDESTRSRIFEPFFTTKAIGKGTGLGLSIIYGIVRQSGGHIWVYSEPGQGTAFKIYLPRVFAPAEKAALPARAAPVSEPASGTILVVEDEKPLAEMTQAALRDSGYTVLLASNGEEAVNVARSHAGPIDLLLTDVVLSAGISGVELAAHLRVLRPEIKVIYMSGYSDVLVKAEADVGSGAVLLEKPFNVEALRATVKRELGRVVSP